MKSRSSRKPFAGIVAGATLGALICTAQAQQTPDTQVSEVRSFDMSLGVVSPATSIPPEAAGPRRSPIGDSELARIKSLASLAAAGGRGAPAQDTIPVKASLTNCPTNTGNAFPSDSHGAAGPTNIIQVSNVDIGVYDKTDCTIVSRVAFTTFFAAFGIPGTEFLFDPRVVFDPAVNRFFVEAESRNSSNTDQFQYFAVSKDSSGTSWWLYRVVLSQGANFFCKQAANSFWDYPNVGFNNARWFITANDFGTTVPGAILSIDKVPTLSGVSPVTISCFKSQPANLAPPIVLDGSSSAFFLSPGSGSGSSIARRRLDVSPAGPASDTVASTTAITVPAWTAAPGAAQPNGLTLDTLDGRFQSASIQIGGFLAQVHTVNNGGAVARRYQFSTTGTSADIIHDLFTSGVDRVFNPSIAMNSSAPGAPAFVTASRTIPSQAEIGNPAMLIFNGTNSSTSWAFDLIHVSPTQFATCKDSPCRWGDYSATQIDPSNTASAWGFNQVVCLTNSGTVPCFPKVDTFERQWHTRAARVISNTGAGTTNLFTSIAPTSRATQVNQLITAYATILNAGSNTATGCSISLPAGVPGNFTYQAVDDLLNPTYFPNTPIDIAPVSVDPRGQGFYFTLTPTAAFSQDIQLVFKCNNTSQAPIFFGINTFRLTVGGAVPDLLMAQATAPEFGIMQLANPSADGFFAVQVLNFQGASGTITFTPTDTYPGQPPRNLPLDKSICLFKPNPADGCVAPPSASVTKTMATGEIINLGVFVKGKGTFIPFDIPNNRVYVVAQQGTTVLSQASVAVKMLTAGPQQAAR
jgi:hypothetical protein